jgi:hypothetical protein
MYESIHQLAVALPLSQSFLGLIVSALAADRLGKWTAGGPTWWKGPLSLVYLAAICALLFCVYSVAVHLMHGE